MSLHKQVQDQIFSQLTAGVERFPKPQGEIFKSQRSYFVLIDFNENEDGNNSVLIKNLLNKLNISHDTRCFCISEHFHVEDNLNANNELIVLEELCKSLKETSPNTLLCFGHRSLLLLAKLLQTTIAIPSEENIPLQEIKVFGLLCRVFYLSSVRDLRDFPVWRRHVWQALQVLQNKL